jgi:hypothetical protein
VIATGEAFMTVRDGEIAGNLEGYDSSITAMSGGHVVGYPIFVQQATFLYSGGTFDLSFVPPSPPPTGAGSQQVLAGAAGGDPFDSPLQGFTAADEAQIHFIGFGLQSTLVDPNFEGKYSVYQLSGRLADRSSIEGGLIYVQNGTGASFELIEAPVPEPGNAVLLVGLGMVSGLRQRGRSRWRAARRLKTWG